MEKSGIKFTYEDYLHLPEGRRYELIEGELFMVPAPGSYHQDVSGNLEFVLRKFVSENNLGKIYDAPIDVVFSEEDVVHPDILFIQKKRLDIIKKENIQGSPDLVIEILSPSIEYRDRVYKKRLYAKHGVKEYWIADPQKREIELMTLVGGDYRKVKTYSANETLESPLLKGLRANLKEVF